MPNCKNANHTAPILRFLLYIIVSLVTKPLFLAMGLTVFLPKVEVSDLRTRVDEILVPVSKALPNDYHWPASLAFSLLPW